LTNKQTSGRGRHGRDWYVNEGNFAGTLALEVNFDINSNFQCSILSLVVGVSIYQALKSLLPKQKLYVKWPNDILIDDAKICGILIEGFPVKNSNHHIQTNRYAIGCGINIVGAPKIEGVKTDYLQAYNPKLDFEVVSNIVIDNVETNIKRWISGLDSILMDEWRAATFNVGTAFKTTIAGQKQIVRYKNIRDDGTLVVISRTGEVIELKTGDLTIV